MNNKILIVEDELIIATHLHHLLETNGYDITDVVRSGMDAINSINKQKPDLVLVDIVLDGAMDGIELTSYIKSHFAIPCVFTTANSDTMVLEQALHVNPDGYLRKPLNNQKLLAVLSDILSFSL